MLSRIVISGAAVLALAITVFASGDALAGKGGSLETTISMSAQTRLASATDASGPMVFGDAIFNVTRSVPYDRETIWVTQHCFDAAGNRISKLDYPVLWGTSISLEGTTWPFPTNGASCTAFVTLRPWQDRVLGDSTMSFSVGQ